MDNIFTRMENWLGANAPLAASGLNSPATASEIAQTEKLLGVSFPADFRAAYLRHNGQKFDSPWMLSGWEWLSLDRIRDEWLVWKGLLDGGDFDGIFSDADGAYVRKDWWNAQWIPVSYSGSGDHHCIDLAPGPNGISGQIIEMWHDEGSRPVVAESFEQFLSQLVAAFEAGEFIFSADYNAIVCKDDA